MTRPTLGFVITNSLLQTEKRIISSATSYNFRLFVKQSLLSFFYLALLLNSAQTAANTSESEKPPMMSCPQNFNLQVDGSVGPILVCGGDVIPLCFTGDNLPAGGMVSFQVDSDNDGTFEEEICSQPIPDTPCPMPTSSSGGNVFFASLIANGDGGECGVAVPESITICNGCSCDTDNPDVDISGWELDDNTGGTGPGDPSHIFSAGTILASGDCITLSCNYSERTNNIWNNSSDDATLHDTSGNLIDMFSYTDDGQDGEELIGACEVSEAPICCDYQIPDDICGSGTLQFRAVVTPFDTLNCPSGASDELDSLTNIIVANSDCPFASIEVDTVVLCAAESTLAMIPISIIGGTGPFNIEYLFNGILITGVGFNDGDMLTIPGLTMGPIDVSLSSVIDLGGSECEGIVGDEEVVVDFKPMSAITLSSASDTNDCFCNGSISFDGPSDISFDIFYTLNGVLDSLIGITLPATLPNFCPGDYVITGAVDDFGCTASVSGAQTIGMADAQIPVASAVDESVCDGQDIELIESSNNGSSWSWTGPASFSSTLQSPVVSGSALPGVGTHTYSLLMTDSNGCTATDEIEILVNSNPVPVAEAVDSIYCDRVNIELEESSGLAREWSWSGPNGFSSTMQNPDVTLFFLPGPGTHTYTVTITDGNDCTGVDDVEIVVHEIPTSSIMTDRAICAGEDILLTESGGDAITWQWTSQFGFSSTAQNPVVPGADVIGPGTELFELTITDSNGCTFADEIDVDIYELPSCTITTTNSSCGVSDGTLTAVPTGGADGYTFEWSNMASSETISNLAAGNYTLTVTDSNGCTSSCEATVNASDAPTCSLMAFDTSCGESNGTVIGSAIGGIAPYTYQWALGDSLVMVSGSAVDTIGIIFDAAADTYIVTVTDAAGCTSTCEATVNASDAPTCSLVTTDTSCGTNDGSVAGTAMGGVAPYTYLWNTGDTLAVISGLAADTYTLTVTDANGCTSTCEAIVNTSDAPTCNAVSTDTTCGESDGAVSGSASGGVEPYTFEWSNGETTGTITGLVADSYTLTVTDANGCTSTCEAIVNASDAPTCTLVATDTNCGDDGSVAGTVMGGEAPYLYLWNTGDTLSVMSGLIPDTYILTVTDANGCTSTCEAIVDDASGLPTCTVAVIDTSCGENNGSVTANASGGTPPYSYVWNMGQSSSTISNLSQGTYTVTIADANGCTSTCSGNVGESSALSCNATSNSPVCGGELLQLMETGGDAVSWSWTGPNGFSSFEQNPEFVATNSSAGSYQVVIAHASGCLDSCIVNIEIDSPETNEGAFIAACEDPFGSFMSNFTLENAENLANGDIDGDGADGSVDDVTYYANEVDALNMLNPLSNGMNLFNNPLYVRVQSGDCFSIEKLRLDSFRGPEYTAEPTHVTQCNLADGSICFEGLRQGGLNLRYTDPNGLLVERRFSSDVNGEYCLSNLSSGLYTDLVIFTNPTDLFCSGPVLDIEIFDAEMTSAIVSNVEVCEGSALAPIIITDVGCPITHILIDFEDPSFTDVPTLTPFMPGDQMTIPDNLPPGNYTGSMSLICSNNCLTTDEFVITVIENLSPGESTVIEICNEDPSQFSFNLFDRLGGAPDGGGTWSLPQDSLSLISLSNGDQGTVNLQGVNPGSYVFEYSIEASEICGEPSTVEVVVTACYDLALTKVLTTTSNVTPGSQVTFDITVINQGSVAAYDVAVADYFPNCLMYVDAQFTSHTGGGIAPVVTDNGLNGFMISTIPSGEFVVVTITMTVSTTCTNPSIVNNAEIIGGSSTPGGPIAFDADSMPDDDSGSPPDSNDNNVTASDGGDDFDPAILNICFLGCDGTFPWNGSN